eukprot:scaffold254965_cov28-Tisochrysis_lutea.AAC.2
MSWTDARWIGRKGHMDVVGRPRKLRFDTERDSRLEAHVRDAGRRQEHDAQSATWPSCRGEVHPWGRKEIVASSKRARSFACIFPYARLESIG